MNAPTTGVPHDPLPDLSPFLAAASNNVGFLSLGGAPASQSSLTIAMCLRSAASNTGEMVFFNWSGVLHSRFTSAPRSINTRATSK